MALGAAHLLSKEKLNGRVRFLFQPSEETADEEGLSGAQRMEQEGAVIGVDYVIAQHVDPTSPVGTIAINEGIRAAAAWILSSPRSLAKAGMARIRTQRLTRSLCWRMSSLL